MRKWQVVFAMYIILMLPVWILWFSVEGFFTWHFYLSTGFAVWIVLVMLIMKDVLGEEIKFK